MYAILRHGKIKSTTKGVAAGHNHRQGEPAPSLTSPHFRGNNLHRSPNINPALTRLNWVLHKEKGADAVVKRINMKLPKNRRKDAVEAVEMIITASPEFFDSIEVDREKLAKHPKFKEWVNATIKWVEQETGDRLVDLVLHLDENTPHIHAIFVPLTDDGRLCAKQVTAQLELKRRQTTYAQAMKRFGLERGEDASFTGRQHMPLKGDRKLKGKASKIKLPKLPIKTGIFDLGYVERLEVHAKGQQKLLRELLAERHRVEKSEMELSRAIQHLPDELVQAERIRTLENALKTSQDRAQGALDQLSKIASPLSPLYVDPDYASRMAAKAPTASAIRIQNVSRPRS